MRKNILLITSDQQHYSALGCVNPQIKTPNLDRLAAEGTRFDRAYTVNPTCTPTRASIITGKYPSQHGAWSLGTKLPEDETTVGELLGKAGYKTALVGKAHFQPIGETAEYSSLESMGVLQDLDFWRQFDQPFYGFGHVELARNHTNERLVGQHYAIWMEEKGLTNWRDYFLPPTGRMDKSIRYRWDIPEEYHYDAWIAERTNALMDTYVQEEQPFFLWASFFDPHPDYLAPAPWYSMYDDQPLNVPRMTPGEHQKNPPHFGLTQETSPNLSAYYESGQYVHGVHSHMGQDEESIRKNMSVYYGMTSLLDKYIGKILDHLDALGQRENTLVIFTSDHGHYFGQHGLHYKGPFHYEGGIKVPFIARLPGQIKAGHVDSSIQSLVDLCTTMLAYAGLPIPRSMTGINQLSYWTGQSAPLRTHAVCEHHHEPTVINLRTYINDRYKITVYMNQTYGEQFDLKNDPQEVNNLWDDPAHAALKQELLLQYIWAELAKEPMWMPRIAGA